MSHLIVDTVHILGMENFDDYGCLNPAEITINSKKIIKTVSIYKKYTFRFIIETYLVQICETILT